MKAEILSDRNTGGEEGRDQGRGTAVATRENEEGDRLKTGEIVSLKEVVSVQARD